MNEAFIDLLEARFGLSAKLRVIANVGGMRLTIPMPHYASRSRLADRIGPEIAVWLAENYGGEDLQFPSSRSLSARAQAALLAARVFEAGLTNPTVSANTIAREFGVTAQRVKQVRAELRQQAPPPVLPLFPDIDG